MARKADRPVEPFPPCHERAGLVFHVKHFEKGSDVPFSPCVVGPATDGRTNWSANPRTSRQKRGSRAPTAEQFGQTVSIRTPRSSSDAQCERARAALEGRHFYTIGSRRKCGVNLEAPNGGRVSFSRPCPKGVPGTATSHRGSKAPCAISNPSTLH